MRFADMVTRVIAYSQRTTSDNTIIKQSINDAQDEIAGAWQWPFLMTEGRIFTVAPYTDGTVTVTNGSRTVTGASTTFTAQMVGRKFRLSDSSPYYVVSGYTSATVITLDKPYNGSNASGSTYSIFQDEYLLPADIDMSRLFRSQSQRLTLLDIDPSDFDISIPYPTERGVHRISIQSSSSLLNNTYTVGTVVGTAGQYTLTGSSTSWLSVPGLGRMSEIQIGSYSYRVKSVDSDTAITLYDVISATVSASAYTILLSNPIVQLWPIPDSNYEILFRYYRRIQPLIQDQDSSDIPNAWHFLIVFNAIKLMFMYTGEITRLQTMAAYYQGQLKSMIGAVGSSSSDTSYRMKSLDERQYLPAAARFPSQYPRTVT